jgi:hypothetical protein
MGIAMTPFKSASSQTGSADYVDYRIWRAGVKRHLNEGVPNGDERTYLRGLHQYSSLGTLSNFLLSKIANSFIRTQSVWVDKHPQAHFGVNDNCELGDLLVLLRVSRLQGNQLNSYRVGWILQGKTTDDPKCVKHGDSSTLDEINLYENYLDFSLRHFSQRLGTFDLNKDPDIGAGSMNEKWSFLQFCLNDRFYNSNLWGASPIQRLWPLGSPAKSPSAAHSSFADAILQMASGSGNSPSAYGAVLDRNPEWKKLCDTLLAFTRPRNSRLARGQWQRVYPGYMPYYSRRIGSHYYPRNMKMLMPLFAEGQDILTGPVTHSFVNQHDAMQFERLLREAHYDMSHNHDGEGGGPDNPDFGGDDEEPDGGMSTLVIDIVTQGEPYKG